MLHSEAQDRRMRVGFQVRLYQLREVLVAIIVASNVSHEVEARVDQVVVSCVMVVWQCQLGAHISQVRFVDAHQCSRPFHPPHVFIVTSVDMFFWG